MWAFSAEPRASADGFQAGLGPLILSRIIHFVDRSVSNGFFSALLLGSHKLTTLADRVGSIVALGAYYPYDEIGAPTRITEMATWIPVEQMCRRNKHPDRGSNNAGVAPNHMPQSAGWQSIPPLGAL